MSYTYGAARSAAVVTPREMRLRAELDAVHRENRRLRRESQRLTSQVASLLDAPTPTLGGTGIDTSDPMLRRSILTAELDAFREARCAA